MGERGFAVDHSTIQHWVIEYASKLEKAFRQIKWVILFHFYWIRFCIVIEILNRHYMEIEIRKSEVTDSAALKMLWQFYQYHQSSFDLEDVGPDGRFDIDEEYLDRVLRCEEDCIVYFVFVSNQIAGFATVEPTEILGKEMLELADIFILPKYRNKGIAKFVIQHLMQDETNQWHVAVYINDTLALKFWNHLLSKLNVATVDKVEPAETEGYHEFVITNTEGV